MTQSCIAVIPARGGSTRIPDKNILDFFGRPLIAYAIDAARESGAFAEVHVSTDSARIRDVVERLGLEVPFLRDPALADDRTPLMPVLQWVLRTFAERGRRFNDVCLLLPTAPLIEATDIRDAHATYLGRTPPRPLLAVSPYPVPVEWAFERAADGSLAPVQPGMFAVRSQDLSKKYYDTGTIAFFPAWSVLSATPPDDRSFTSYVLPREKAVDIDDEADLALARALFGARRANRRR